MANMSKQEQEDIVREMEREMLKKLLERGKLESETLNLQLMSSDDSKASKPTRSRARPRILEATATENAPSSSSSGSEKPSPGGHDTTNEDLALFVLICMLVGQFMKQAAARTGIPYTCLITVFGFVMGTFQNSMVPRMKRSLLIWGQMDPHLLLLLFIPALIFESAFNSDWHMFKKEMG